jgi:hypothetical protein
MKRIAQNFAFIVAVSFVSAMLMTAAACPDNEVVCLLKE